MLQLLCPSVLISINIDKITILTAISRSDSVLGGYRRDVHFLLLLTNEQEYRIRIAIQRYMATVH